MRKLLPLLAITFAACGGQRAVTPTGQLDFEGGRSTAAPGEDKRAEVMRIFMDATQARLGGQAPKAVALYQQCLQSDPKNDASMFELAKLYHAAQSFEPAVAYAKQAVATDKNNIWYRFLLADLYKQNSQAEDAAAVYKGIIELWPDRFEVYMDMAGAYAFANKPNEAMKAFADTEKRFGLSQELVDHQFNTLMGMQKFPEAEALITRAIAQYPDDAQYVAMLADLYDEQGDHEKALINYKRALDLDPSNSMLRIALAEHYYGTGRMDEAYHELGEAFLDPELDVDAKMQVLIGFFEMTDREGEKPGQREDLIQRSYALIGSPERAHPESGKPHTIHGDFLLRDGKFMEARDEFKKARVLEKDKYPIHLQILQLDLQLRDHVALAADADSTIELFPTVPEPYLYKGLGLSQLGKYSDAEEAFITGRDLVVDNPQLTAQFWSSLGEMYNDAKQFEKSDAAYDKSLALVPDDANTLNNYAYYLSVRNEQLEKAERMTKRSNELSPNQPSYLDTYAWVLFRAKKYAEARTWMEKAIAASPAPNGELLEHYGDILFELGETTAALEQWKSAKERGGTSDLIDRKINEGKRVE
ncbi:MAG TPA: tetratricopeptide repeat protein [Flavobacteriales bacterium]|nr:tetratricopeptide repeat protein [Flavobacteriales bacterium]